MREFKTEAFKSPVTLGDMPENHPARLFYDYWKELCAEADFALKADFNPADIPRLLPNICILKLDDSGPELGFNLTLIGEGVKNMSGVTEMADYERYLYTGDNLADRRLIYGELVKAPQVRFYRMKVPFPGRQFIEIIKGIFPFSSDGKKIDYFYLVMERIQEFRA